MLKKILLVFAAFVVLGVAIVGWTVVRPIYQMGRQISPETAPEDLAKQDDSRVKIPKSLALEPRPYDPLKNVYWGELHVHTTESLDAVLFGTTATPEDAYRFARGEPLLSPGGELMQLSRPLDFMAITACTPASGTGAGVSVTSSTSITGTSVKNGSISGMGRHGVGLGAQAEVRNLRVRHNGVNGIWVNYGSTVSGNTAFRNGYYGIQGSSGSTISGNTANSNGGAGIRVNGGSTVSGNTARYNAGYGLYFNASNSAYSGNVISGNTAGTVIGTAVQLGQNACNGNTTCP